MIIVRPKFAGSRFSRRYISWRHVLYFNWGLYVVGRASNDNIDFASVPWSE